MRAAGDVFERRARAELERAGLTCLASNYTTRHGELDLVMRERHTIVFVEVRYRKSATHGDAAASVTSTKQVKLVLAAQLADDTAGCALAQKSRQPSIRRMACQP
jgi:putative endonuclease